MSDVIADWKSDFAKGKKQHTSLGAAEEREKRDEVNRAVTTNKSIYLYTEIYFSEWKTVKMITIVSSKQCADADVKILQKVSQMNTHHLDSLLKNLRKPRKIARSRRKRPVTAPFSKRSRNGCLVPSSSELPGLDISCKILGQFLGLAVRQLYQYTDNISLPHD